MMHNPLYPRAIKTKAKKKGLSVSPYVQLAMPQKDGKLLDQSINDLKSHELKVLTLAEFNRQIDGL